MMIMLFILACLSTLAILVLSALVILYAMAKADLQATLVENGGFKFVVMGNSLMGVIDKIDDGYVDTKTHEVKKLSELNGLQSSKRRFIGPLEDYLGIIWVSFLYPLRKIHWFEVGADKLHDDERIEKEGLPVRRQLHQELRWTNYLRYRFPHPVLITDVELGEDRWKVDMIVILDVKVVNPVIIVFDYKGKVLQQVDAAVKAAVIDFCNEPNFGYSKFVQAKKGSGSGIAKSILRLNSSTTTEEGKNEVGEVEEKTSGLPARFGIEIQACWIETAALSPDQKELDDAARAIEMEKQLATAQKEKAEGLRALEKETRTGIGEGLESIINSLTKAGVAPQQAASIAHEQVRTGNMATAGLTTYVESGSSVIPTLNITEKKGEESK